MDNSKIDGYVRPARPEDATYAAPLIIETGYDTIIISFGSLKKGNHVLKRMFSLPSNMHSFQHSSVYVNQNKVKGLLLGYGSEEERKETLTSSMLLISSMGIYGLLLLERLLRIRNLIGEIPDEDYYIHCLAVSPELRGLGIGSLLMKEAERIAKLSNKKRISLLVEARNKRAIKFYLREGFKVIGQRYDTSFKQRFNFDSYMKMTKAL